MLENMNNNTNENNGDGNNDTNENHENKDNENNLENNGQENGNNDGDGNDVNMIGNTNPDGINGDNRLRKERSDEAPNISTYTFQNQLAPNINALTMDDINQVQTEHGKKQLIGERLFPKIHKKEPTKAVRLTSMILTLEIEQVFPLLSDDVKLDEMIQNTLKIMQEREERDKKKSQNDKQMKTNIKEKVSEMRQQHEQVVENLLSPNSGNENMNALGGDISDL